MSGLYPGSFAGYKLEVRREEGKGGGRKEEEKGGRRKEERLEDK